MSLVDTHTKLLLHGEELIDSGLHGVPLTNYGVTVSADNSKFGGKSLYFNANKIELPIPVDLTGNWTFEWWEYVISNQDGGASAVFSTLTGTSYGFNCGSMSGTTQRISAGTTDYSNYIPITTIGQIKTNTWAHRAVCKQGNTIYCFENGVLQRTVNTTGVFWTGNILTIGMRVGGTVGGFRGYLDEVRILDRAERTGNFTPPTEPYYTFVLNDIPALSVSPAMLKEGETITATWTTPEIIGGELDGYVLERTVKNETFEQVYSGTNLTYSETVQEGWKSIKYRVKAVSGEHETEWTVSNTVTVYKLADYQNKIVGVGI